ncbi:MAG: RNA polymerase sigma factor [Solirubrobacteraceae bacterium]
MSSPSGKPTYRDAIAAPRVIEDERVLVALARAGERAAFDELVRRHADGLFAVVVRLCADGHEAEEVTQEAFLRAWRGLPGFHGDAQFFTWLYRIGVNKASRRAYSRRRRADVVVVSLDEQREQESPDRFVRPAERAEQSDLRRMLEAAIAALPVDHRAALVLRDVEGLSTTQAAAVLGLREAAFKSRLHRARKLLRSGLADYARQRGSL